MRNDGRGKRRSQLGIDICEPVFFRCLGQLSDPRDVPGRLKLVGGLFYIQQGPEGRVVNDEVQFGESLGRPGDVISPGVAPVGKGFIIGRNQPLVDANVANAPLIGYFPAREGHLFIVHQPRVLRGSLQGIAHGVPFPGVHLEILRQPFHLVEIAGFAGPKQAMAQEALGPRQAVDEASALDNLVRGESHVLGRLGRKPG